MKERKERVALAEARSLVEMLEYMLASQGEAGRELPTSGIRLTLRQVHECLVGLEDGSELRSMTEVPMARAVRQTPEIEAPMVSEAPSGEVEVGDPHVGAGSLAARIQMAPLPRASRRGYSRELGSPETPKQQEPASVE